MNKKISWLSALLCLQLIIAALLFGFNQTEPSEATAEKLLNISKESLNKLVINGDSSEIILEKSSDKWLLPEFYNLPINQTKMDRLLTTLNDLKTNWPVATSRNSHERFEVSDKQYQRKVRLFENNIEVGTLLLGTSPGFKKNHLRMINDDNVYALKINTYDFPLKNNDWVNKSLLSYSGIKHIKGKDYELIKNDDEWAFTTKGLSLAEQQVDQNKVSELVNSFTSLVITSVLDVGTESVPKFDHANSLTIEISDAEKLTFNLTELDNKYYIKRSDFEPIFEISQHHFNKLNDVSYTSLIKAVNVSSGNEEQEAEAEN